MVDTAFTELRFGRLHYIVLEDCSEDPSTPQPRYFPALVRDSSDLSSLKLSVFINRTRIMTLST